MIHFTKKRIIYIIKKDYVLTFKIQEGLMPRFVENSSYENVCIYVKITWPDGMKPMFIIS